VVAGVLLSFAWSQVQARRLEREVTGLRQSIERASVDRQAIDHRVADERRRADDERASLQKRLAALRDEEQSLSGQLGDAPLGGMQGLRAELRLAHDRLQALESERATGETVIRDYGPGVCLIQGSFAYYDAQDRPLHTRLDGAGETVKEADGTPSLDVAGNGPVYTIDYYGTGFLVDQGGLILTNRHIAEPWWNDDASTDLAHEGYKPRFVFLRGFFPHQTAAFTLKPRQIAESVDLAIVHADLRGRRIPVLPLDDSGRTAVAGHPVVVLGYPTGLEAIMAKADTRVVKSILDSNGADTQKVTQALSEQGLIRPSTTQGHIGDVTGSDIVFDAPTTQGGSGGPLFSAAGRVIAVEYAVLPKFGGNSFAVPIAYALKLLRAAQGPAARAD
jgi:hypothetical protein